MTNYFGITQYFLTGNKPLLTLNNVGVLPLFDNYFVFYEQGCWISAEGSRNCTKMCLDSALIWGNGTRDLNTNATANLWNCLTYPILSEGLTQGYLRGRLDVEYVMYEFALEELTQDTLLAMYNSTALCGVEYCNTTFDSSHPCNGSLTTYPWTGLTQRSTIVSGYYSEVLCKTLQYSLNNDVGGVGVAIAYLLQVAILLTFWLGLRYLTASSNFLDVIRCRRRSPPRQRLSNPKSRDRRHSSTDRIGIWVSSLAQFQKAQCYFWLATDVAVLVATRSAFTLQANSWAELELNMGALQTICFGSYLLATFGLFCLHLCDKRSAYTLVLTLVTILMAAVSSHRASSFNTRDVIPASGGPWQGACGPISPATYCGHTYSYLLSAQPILADPSQWPQFYVCLIIMIGLSLDFALRTVWSHLPSRLKTRIDAPKAFQHLVESLTIWNMRSRWARIVLDWEKLLRIVPAASRVLIEAFFLVYMGIFSENIIHLALLPGLAESSQSNLQWSFGQIIALTIWFPLIFDFLYALIFGLEEASDHHIAAPYKVVNTATRSSLVTAAAPVQPLSATVPRRPDQNAVPGNSTVPTTTPVPDGDTVSANAVVLNQPSSPIPPPAPPASGQARTSNPAS